MDWFQLTNALAGWWAGAMWRASWQGGLALALVWLICRLAPRISPQARSWLWRLAYLKFLLSLVWASPLDLPILPALARPTMRALAERKSSDARNDLALAVSDAPEPDQHATVNWSEVLFGLWFSGTVLVLGRLLDEWRRMKSLIAASHPLASPDLASCCVELMDQLHLRRLPKIVVFDGVASPLVFGVFRPVIILPRRMIGEFSAAELRLTLAHELAHLRRGDLLWTWIPALVNGLFFFHPLVWMGRREWQLAQEMACDGAVLDTTRASARDYGEMLLKLFTMASASEPKGWLVAGMSEPGHNLKRRLDMLRHFRSSSRRAQLVAIGLLAVIGLIPWRLVASPSAHVSSSPDSTAWGKAGEGIEVGLQLVHTRKDFRVGENLEAEVKVRNTGATPVRITYPSPTQWSATFASSGEILLLPADSGNDFEKLASLNLAPGETKSLFDSNPMLCLQDQSRAGTQNDFSLPMLKLAPGHYRVFCQPGHLFMSLNGGVWPGNIKTAQVDFDLLPAQAGTAASPDATAAAVIWGQQIRGLQAGIAFAGPRTVFHFGEKMQLDFYIRNVFDKPIAFTFRPLRDFEWEPLLTDDQRDPIADRANPETASAPLTTVTLNPGERFTVGHPVFELTDASLRQSSLSEGRVLAVTHPGEIGIRCRLCQRGEMGGGGALRPWAINLMSGALKFKAVAGDVSEANAAPGPNLAREKE